MNAVAARTARKIISGAPGDAASMSVSTSGVAPGMSVLLLLELLYYAGVAGVTVSSTAGAAEAVANICIC